MYLHQYFEEKLDDIFQRHDGEQEKDRWEKTGHYEMEKRDEVDGEWFHLFDESKAVAEVGEGLNVAGSEQGSFSGLSWSIHFFWNRPVYVVASVPY